MKPLIIPIFIPHQGCPHRCIFCDQRAITAASDRLLGPQQLAARIESYLSYAGPQRGPAQVAFYGGNFLGLKRETLTGLLEALGPWLGDGRIQSIRCSTRPDTITAERLAWIAPYPVETIEVGVQSMNDHVLERSRRGHTAADTVRAISRLQRAGYRSGVQLMLGLPGDNARRALASARAVSRLKPDFVRIYPTLVLANSPLAADYRAGRYTPLVLSAAVEQAKTLLCHFHRRHISVIRMGLQAADGLDDPAVVLSGPHHPAFGHLVYADLYRDAAQRLLESAGPLPEAPILKVHPRCLSQLQGHHRSTLTAMRTRFRRPRLRFMADDGVAPGRLVCGGRSAAVWP